MGILQLAGLFMATIFVTSGPVYGKFSSAPLSQPNKLQIASELRNLSEANFRELAPALEIQLGRNSPVLKYWNRIYGSQDLESRGALTFQDLLELSEPLTVSPQVSTTLCVLVFSYVLNFGGFGDLPPGRAPTNANNESDHWSEQMLKTPACERTLSFLNEYIESPDSNTVFGDPGSQVATVQ